MKENLSEYKIQTEEEKFKFLLGDGRTAAFFVVSDERNIKKWNNFNTELSKLSA